MYARHSETRVPGPLCHRRNRPPIAHRSATPRVVLEPVTKPAAPRSGLGHVACSMEFCDSLFEPVTKPAAPRSDLGHVACGMEFCDSLLLGHGRFGERGRFFPLPKRIGAGSCLITSTRHARMLPWLSVVSTFSPASGLAGKARVRFSPYRDMFLQELDHQSLHSRIFEQFVPLRELPLIEHD